MNLFLNSTLQCVTDRIFVGDENDESDEGRCIQENAMKAKERILQHGTKESQTVEEPVQRKKTMKTILRMKKIKIKIMVQIKVSQIKHLPTEISQRLE